MSDTSDIPEIIPLQTFQLGGLWVDPARNLLKSTTDSFHIEPRIMNVLQTLAAQSREVVTRDALIETIWNVEFGADESLTRAISLLRKTFREAGEPDGHIETIPKRGYRLATPVTEAATPPAKLVGAKKQVLKATAPIATQASADTSPKALSKTTAKIIALILAVVLVLVLTAIQKFYISPIGTQLATGKGRSVAIMSFTDMSSAKDQEHLTDGITEEIFTALAEIPSLRIAGRSSSFAYKGKSADMRTVGEKLNVSHIIDGSIRTQGKRVRVTTQLINTSDGLHVWTKSYDGFSTDIFGLQERVSQDIVSELRVVLSVGFEDTIPIDINIPVSE